MKAELGAQLLEHRSLACCKQGSSTLAQVASGSIFASDQAANADSPCLLGRCDLCGAEASLDFVSSEGNLSPIILSRTHLLAFL
mmetsp:Transcript_6610/g.13396  ORF Transcript_6610/g.13396 Transcript_6610/m.13396 type:complete len:84 (+) Transcript_6610:375-626(+)